jgi:small subunit ribosomal protein S13
MARIAGINIPMNKHVVIGLTHIYGVGRSPRQGGLRGGGVDPTTKVKDLTESEVARPALAGREAGRSRATCAARSR